MTKRDLWPRSDDRWEDRWPDRRSILSIHDLGPRTGTTFRTPIRLGRQVGDALKFRMIEEQLRRHNS